MGWELKFRRIRVYERRFGASRCSVSFAAPSMALHDMVSKIGFEG